MSHSGVHVMSWFLSPTLRGTQSKVPFKCGSPSRSNPYNIHLINHFIVIIYWVHPRRLTWNLKMMVWKMFFLFQRGILRFHFNLLWCNVGYTRFLKAPPVGGSVFFNGCTGPPSQVFYHHAWGFANLPLVLYLMPLAISLFDWMKGEGLKSKQCSIDRYIPGKWTNGT